jgi:hypothetical protein
LLRVRRQRFIRNWEGAYPSKVYTRTMFDSHRYPTQGFGIGWQIIR